MKYPWPVLIWTVNIGLIGFLAVRIIPFDNDKSPFVFIFGYLCVVALNLAVWGISSLIKTTLAAHMGRSVTVLAILFVPLLVYLINF